MIYVYAITDPACAAPPESRGLDDCALVARTIENVVAVLTNHDLRQVTPTPENLWRHETVVESIMRQCDAVLPARFGTLFADVSALDETLARHATSLAAGLRRVRGCVELGLRVLWQPKASQPDPKSTGGTDIPVCDVGTADTGKSARATNIDTNTNTTSGRAYMQARLEDERRRRATAERAERLATELHDALAPLARDSTRRVLPSADVLLSSAYLVPRGDADAFAARARELSASHPDLRLLCTGPWPPYHFAPPLATTEVSRA